MKTIKIRAPFEKVKKVIYSNEVKIGKENLAKTGAKVYYSGNGWWTISGYAHNGIDTLKTVNEILA